MHTDIRAQQVEEGRRMTAAYGEGQREAYPNPVRRRISLDNPIPPRFNKKPAAPKKPQGHEAFLKVLEASKAEVDLVTTAGETFTGIVKHSDKFTISLKLPNRGTIVFFKHAIESFEPLDPPPNAPDQNEATED